MNALSSQQPDTLVKIDIQQVLDNSPFQLRHWLIFILGFLVITTDGLNTGSIGYVAPTLTQIWGVQKSDLGPVLSTALIGMAIGALVAGPIADRFGRKWVVIFTTVFFAAWSIASAYATSINQLVIFRFLTGLGLGAAMPNVATLVSEYMPKKRRSFMVNLMFCGFPFGIAMGGVLSASLIPAYGWPSVFWVFGAFPLALAVVLLFVLPESLQYLVHRHYQEAVRRMANKVFGTNYGENSEFYLPKNEIGNQGSSFSVIFSKQYFTGTATLWASCFMTLLVFYLLSSWMPTLLEDAGFKGEQAKLLTAVFPFGGIVGTILIGMLMDRIGGNKALVISYFVTVALLILTSLTYANIFLFSIFIFLSGAGVGGAQSSLPALAAQFYPVQGRAAGVSWMHGIGRLGAVFGAFFGAAIFRLEVSLTTVFIVLSLPILVAGIAMVVKNSIKRQDV